MALTVETGSGVSGAESYVSVADADTFLKSELAHDTWTEATTQDKERALRMSTRLIDETCMWRGFKSAIGNALEWPRQYATKDERDYQGLDVYFDENEIPTRLERAVALFASILLNNPNYLTDLDEARVASSTTDAGSKAYDRRRQTEILPASVRLILRSLCNGPEIPVRRVA